MAFHLRRAGLGALLRSAEVTAVLTQVAEEAKAKAEGIAPVYTGEYKSAFVVTPGIKPDRACVVLRNESPHAMEVEFGAGNTPRHRTLGKAVGVVSF